MGVKAGTNYGSFIPRVNKRVGGRQVQLSDFLLTRATPERFKDKSLMTKQCTNACLTLLTHGHVCGPVWDTERTA